MINLVEARNDQGALLSLSLLDNETGMIVTDIDGLDPVKATISTSNYAKRDGVQYQSSQRGERNIVLTIDLDPDYFTTSVDDLRSQLYAFFLPEAMVSLRFYKANGLVVDSVGVVESCDAPLFTSEPKVTISVIVFDSDFTATTPDVLTGSTVSSLVSRLVHYEGSAKAGFTFVLNVNRTLSEFTIYNRTAGGVTSVFDVSAALVAGDTVTISTVNGNKSVMLTRSGVQSSLLYGMLTGSSWINFSPGSNNLRVYAVGAAIPYTLTYTACYGGL